jgi:hypothetical protein
MIYYAVVFHMTLIKLLWKTKYDEINKHTHTDIYIHTHTHTHTNTHTHTHTFTHTHRLHDMLLPSFLHWHVMSCN